MCDHEYDCVELRVPRVEVSKMRGSSWRREERRREGSLYSEQTQCLYRSSFNLFADCPA